MRGTTVDGICRLISWHINRVLSLLEEVEVVGFLARTHGSGVFTDSLLKSAEKVLLIEGQARNKPMKQLSQLSPLNAFCKIGVVMLQFLKLYVTVLSK